jgi:hypothetical protein
MCVYICMYIQCQCHGRDMQSLTGWHTVHDTSGDSYEDQWLKGHFTGNSFCLLSGVICANTMSHTQDRHDRTAYLNDTGFGCYLWATGMRFEGRFRLSCPQGGVLREANGAVSQVEYDGTTPIIDNPRAGL